MPAVPVRVLDRLVDSLKRFQPILASAKARDAGEADTSTIVKDALAEVFGYDKYTEITSEYLIKGTYCDLAIKLDGKLVVLIEVKAIGLELKYGHTKQAVDYAANQGVEWVVLTNGAFWRVYRVIFAQPIAQEIVYEWDMLSLNPKNRAQVENLFLLAKEGHSKSVLHDFHAQRQATSRYLLAAVILSDAVLEVARRELRRAFPDVRIETGELREAMIQDVLKREVTEGDRADEARKRLGRAQGKVLRARSKAAAAAAGAATGFPPLSEGAESDPMEAVNPELGT